MLDKISLLISERIELRKHKKEYLIPHINRMLLHLYIIDWLKKHIKKIILTFVLSIIFIFIISKVYAYEIYNIKEGDKTYWLKTSIQYKQYNQAIVIPMWQLEILTWMKDSGQMTLTEMLDLLALRTMECNRYDGMCYGINNEDVGPYQINRIHKHIYNPSLMLMQAGKEYKEVLFYFQTKYALKLIRSYMQRYCDWKWSKTNEKRFKCIARAYNGHPKRKWIFAELAWKKREIIKQSFLNF